jgi:hypothetical protein
MFNRAAIWNRLFGPVWAVVLCAGVVLSRPAQCETVVVGFEGTVIYLDDAYCSCMPEDINLGDTMRGYYVYELGAVDTDPSPNMGRYRYSTAPNRFVVYVEDYVFRSAPGAVDMDIQLRDSVDAGWGAEDWYHVNSWNNAVTSPFLPAPDNISIRLEDSTVQALTGDLLPTTPPDLSAWLSGHRVWIDADVWWSIYGILDAITIGPPTGVSLHPGFEPRLSVAPNPFSGSMTLSFQPGGGRTVLSIYDVAGRLVRTVFDGAGVHDATMSVRWDGLDAAGRKLPSGVYFARLVTPTVTEVRKVVLVR